MERTRELHRRGHRTRAWTIAGLAWSGCVAFANETGNLESSSGAQATGSATEDDGEASGDRSSPDAGVVEPAVCPAEFTCRLDRDRDGRPSECDNAPEVYNPEQLDSDRDGRGDVIDQCPTLAGGSNVTDLDGDGVGNACDLCWQPPRLYEPATGFAPGFGVRNIPLQLDVDEDGVGDACDNCPATPNCLQFGNTPGLTPFRVGMDLDRDDPECQTDTNDNGIGDACETEGAGFGEADDFDGDGLPNAVDGCPRLSATSRTCATDAECPVDSTCEAGHCDHPDPDRDGVGTECDTCPTVANPNQILDPAMDDQDRDFVGNACESVCMEAPNPRAMGLFDVSVGGYCCSIDYDGRPFFDPQGNPLGPTSFLATAPGLLALPPGCAEALAEVGRTEAIRASTEDSAELADLWRGACLLPSADQDYDAIPNECDLCAAEFDPTNAIYVDPTGREWPEDGAVCNGDFSCDRRLDPRP